MSRNYRKSTLRAYTSASQTITTGNNIAFADSQRTGESIEFVAGGTSITLRNPGLYLVTFDAFGIESGTAGNLVAQLYNNGVAVPGATDSNTSAAATEVRNLHFTTVVEVLPSCCAVNNDAVLTVRNTGVGTIFGNANITVVKLA